jgi:AcrR family transcriptional regulator
MWSDTPYDQAMLRPASVNRGDIVTDLVIDLLAEGGCPAVTLRALADRVGVTSAGLLHWFGTSDLMWETMAATYGHRWIAFLQDPMRCHRGGPLRPSTATDRLHGFLPGTDEEVIWTRVWLAFVEVGRYRHRVGAVIDRVEAEERVLIARLLGRGSDPLAADAIAALVRGLRHAICAPETPIPVRRAHAVLARQWSG